MTSTPPLLDLARAIARRDARVLSRLRATPALAREALTIGASRASPREFFLDEIGHYLYRGDTLLHVAAAAYAVDVARALLAAGADVSAANRMGAQPLHYAADGGPERATWDPHAQAEIVHCLVEAGADPNAPDRRGVAPLHRAVRCRCTGAVRALLAAGADPRAQNGSRSTPLSLASMTTGKGGSGREAAKSEQAAIVQMLEEALRS
jgi:ankyrin repeat protein